MGGLTPWWLPVAVSTMASFCVLVAAVLTAWAATARDREARRATHESERLAELLDTALALRALLEQVSLAMVHDSALLATYERERSMFRARREAVVARDVRARAVAWERAANDALAGGGGAVRSDERREWHALLAAIGHARRRTVYRGSSRS